MNNSISHILQKIGLIIISLVFCLSMRTWAQSGHDSTRATRLDEVDVFLGVPFNIASYTLLLMMVAQVCGLKPKEFIHTLGDAHIYSNHVEQAKLQLTREPRPLPVMRINPDVKDIFDFHYEDFQLEGYDPHPHIKAEVAV